MNLRDISNLDSILEEPFSQTSASPLKKEHASLVGKGSASNIEFGDPRTDYINLIVYDDALRGQVYRTKINHFKSIEEGKIDLNLEASLKKYLNKNRVYYLRANYHRQIIQPKSSLDDFYRMSQSGQSKELRYNLGAKHGYKLKIDAISDDRTEVRIRPRFIDVDRFDSALSGAFFSFFSEDSKGHEFDHILKINSTEYNYILNWELDDVAYPNWPCSAVVKLYTPLNGGISEGQLLWVDEEVFDPSIEKIKLESSIEKQNNKVQIKGPDFNIKIGAQPLSDTGLESWNSILNIPESERGTTSQSISKFFNSNNKSIELNVGYDDFDNFVRFGLAEERVKNFIWKYRLYERYNSLIDRLDQGGNATQFEIDKLEDRIDSLTSDFDGFELYMWSSSELSGRPGTSSPEFTQYMDEWLKSARAYDDQNHESLLNYLPEYIQTDERNEDFHTFVSMIGHFYDEIWLYIKHMQYNSNRSENSLEPESLSKELSQFISESFGVELYSGFELKEMFSNTAKDLNTQKDAQHQVWRRLLNSVPYINKSRGTIRSIRALMNAYGIPRSHLSVSQFVDGSSTSKDVFTQKNTNYEFTKLDSSSMGSVSIGWNKNAKTFEYFWRSNQSTQLISSNDALSKTTAPSLFSIKSNSSGGLELNTYSGVTEPEGIIQTNSKTIDLGHAQPNDSSLNTLQLSIDKESKDLIFRFGKVGKLGPNTSLSGLKNNLTWLTTEKIDINDDFIHAWENTDNITLNSNQEFLTSRFYSKIISEEKFAEHVLSPSKINSNSDWGEDVFLGAVNAKTLGMADKNKVSDLVREWSLSVKSGAYAKTNDSNISIEDTELTGLLSPKEKREESNKKRINTNKISVCFNPYSSLNDKIANRLKNHDINSVTANPKKYYEAEYDDLRILRKKYTKDLNSDIDVNKYIKYVENYNKAFFKQLRKMTPGAAGLTQGVLLEPNILEKYKEKGTSVKIEESKEESKIEIIDSYAQQRAKISSKKVDINVYDSLIEKARSEFVSEANEDVSSKKYTLSRRSNGALFYERIPPSNQKIKYIKPIWDTDDYFHNNYFISHGEGSTYYNPQVESKFSGVYSESSYTEENFSRLIETPIGKIKAPPRGYKRYRHYTYNKEFRTGAKRSKYEGSTQSSATTIDGGPAVEVTQSSAKRLTVSPADRDKGDGQVLDVQ